MRKKPVGSPDAAILLGLLLAGGGILGGLTLEGGDLGEIVQATGALIVFGGTLGAVFVATRVRVVRSALASAAGALFPRRQSPGEWIDQIVALATKARKTGIVSLEDDVEKLDEPFLKKALSLAVDGVDPVELRKMMELEMDLGQAHHERGAKVFAAAGGFAPTIGILGAVLGLMQVMKHLSDIDEVGRGISTAFVATVYGVGSANVLFIPLGNKIRAWAEECREIQEMMLDGVIGICEGLNPKLIRLRLEAYTRHSEPAKPKKPVPAKSPEPVKVEPKKPVGEPTPA